MRSVDGRLLDQPVTVSTAGEVIRTDEYVVSAELRPDNLAVRFQVTGDSSVGSFSGVPMGMSAVVFSGTSRSPGDTTLRYLDGVTRADIEHISVTVNGTEVTTDTVASADFPGLRFFATELPLGSGDPSGMTVVGTGQDGSVIYRHPVG